jgi:hypothetical protein
MADFASNEGICFPGHDRLAEDCGITSRYVQTVLDSLAAKGHLTIKTEAKRVMRSESRYSYVVHPTPELSSTVTPELSRTDTGTVSRRHRNSVAPTPELSRTPILTITNHQVNHQGTGRTSPIQSREVWKLLKDEETLTSRIKREVESSKPDTVLIESLKAERLTVRTEMKKTGTRPSCAPKIWEPRSIRMLFREAEWSRQNPANSSTKSKESLSRPYQPRENDIADGLRVCGL